MSKRYNKGFSLIELIVAVAVMALLISPIIAQIFQTMQTSARAKERQYVVDNANLVIEYFKANSMKYLEVTGDKGDAVTINTAPSKSTVTCEVFDESGSTGITVDYDVTDYVLSDATLGRDKNVYTRTVSLDNLSNKLMEAGYDIRYDVTDSSTDAGDLTIWDDITSDNTAVKYDSNNHVKAILCKDRTEVYTDPNEVSLGNIQNLDAKTMAIIDGSASSIDNQFQTDFIKNLVTIISNHKTELEESGQYEYYTDTDNLNSAFDTIRQSGSSTFSRMIVLSILGENVVSGKPSYYRVKCEVYYKAKYVFLGENFGSSPLDNEGFRYTVFEQKFYTDESPDVYFAYEPFVTESHATYNSYAYNDYFVTLGDEYTSGADGSDPSKVYLMKTDSSWSESMVNSGATGDYNDLLDDAENDGRFTYYPSSGTGGAAVWKLTKNDISAIYEKTYKWNKSLSDADNKALSSAFTHDKNIAKSIYKDVFQQNKGVYNNYFLTTSGGSFIPVNINISQALEAGSTALPIQIITNISYLKNEDEDNKLNKEYSSRFQFSTNYPTASDVPEFKIPNYTLVSYPGGDVDAHKIGDISFPDGTDKKSITYPLDDKRNEGRLYSITVRYDNTTRTSDATLYFTGAKGAD